MTDQGEGHQVKPPFCIPDCHWNPMTSNSAVPEDALYQNGELDGEKVYVGRVHDGNNFLVGTAIPGKGVCFYLDKNGDLKSSSNYEVLCISNADPLWFIKKEFADRNHFVSGVNEEENALYTCRYIDDKYNTFYGWTDDQFKTAHIPRDLSRGPQVVHEGFEILVHRFLDRMCTGCPIPIRAMHYSE